MRSQRSRPRECASLWLFYSWLGLCPGSRITGGKIKSSQTRKVINRAANAFRLAAPAVSHSRSALGAFYRRVRSRLGAPKAITATAHKLARLFYPTFRRSLSKVDNIGGKTVRSRQARET
ncbi:MAG: hypothetical protein Fur006_69490 [Coleofasciculaceae cyanobacterium]